MTIDSKLRSRIRSALRKVWMWSEVRRSVKAAARKGRGQYECSECKELFLKVEIDHIRQVGATPGSRVSTPEDTWETFMNKLFCDESNLRAVCKDCHKRKGKK